MYIHIHVYIYIVYHSMVNLSQTDHHHGRLNHIYIYTHCFYISMCVPIIYTQDSFCFIADMSEKRKRRTVPGSGVSTHFRVRPCELYRADSCDQLGHRTSGCSQSRFWICWMIWQTQKPNRKSRSWESKEGRCFLLGVFPLIQEFHDDWRCYFGYPLIEHGWKIRHSLR